MHVRCPQCYNPIDLGAEDSLTDIECPSCGSHFHLVSQDSTTRDAPPPLDLGQFQLIEQVGLGRFGDVWKARDQELDRIVAVKMPRRGDLDSAGSEQFFREARAAAQLKHPNIVSVHEVGRHNGTLYIVSDFIDGPNLSEWLSGHGLSAREAAELCADLAGALHHAHEAGVVHRDIKPGNILMDCKGKPYIADFGLARRDVGEMTITMDGKLLGTPAYMPPEQARGEGHTADRRSDIYALGVILYELLTGQRPFRGERRMLIHQILNDEPMPPRRLATHVPRDLETICLKCLEKEPGCRYATAGQLAEDLRRYLSGTPITARPVSQGERLFRWSRRNPAIAGLLAALFGILLTATVVSSLFAIRANRHAVQRDREANRADEEAARANRNAARADEEAAEASSLLGETLVRQLQLTRTLREQGYLTTVHELVQRLKGRTSQERAGGREKLRLEMMQAMGDFVGYEPDFFNEFPAEARAIALSPDGSELAVALEDGSISTFDTSTQRPHETLMERSAEIWALEYSRDGHRLVSADRDGHVQEWTRTGSGWQPTTTSFEVGPFKEPEDGPKHWLELSDDASLLIVLNGAEVKLWDAQTGMAIRPYPTEPNWMMQSAAISPSRTQIAAGFIVEGTDDYGWAAWDVQTGKRLMHKILSVGATYPSGIAFSGDSQRLAVGFDEALVLYNTDAFDQEMFKRLDATMAVAFAPDNPYLAAVDIRGSITLWNVNTGREVAALGHSGEGSSPTRVTFSANGQRLAAASSDAVSIWDLTAADERLVLAGHPAPIPCAAFSTGGSQLVSGGKDGVVNFWNPETGDRIDSIQIGGPVQAVAFSPDSTLLAIGSWRRGESWPQITLVDPNTRGVLATASAEVVIGNVNGLAFTKLNGQRYLAASGDTGIALCSISRDPATKQIGLRSELLQEAVWALHLAASGDNRWIAWVRDVRHVALWDVEKSQPIELHAPPMLQGWHGLAFFPDNRRLTYIGKQGAAVIWDVIRDQSDFQIGEEGQFKSPHIALSPDGLRLAALTDPDTVAVWNTETRELDYLFRPEGSSVWALAWSPDGQNLVVGRNDGGLAIWRLQRIQAKLEEMGLGTPVRND